ncbi:hypothetical protein GIB67_024270 [Kingdonia uniflora]|uniref:Lycopene epsilon cyclase n=1 Tax=Kingdonia uniflora TaxID=39325 RepID=A0A7J7LZQ2_9MAGN|nr:hypothetical protein GIB67_024270 [Kingdonia uniflora]
MLKATSDYGALTTSVADFQWSQNLRESPTIWGEMLRPIPVALVSCIRYFEAMTAMRETFATLQNLRVGSSSYSSPSMPTKNHSPKSECVTPPQWRQKQHLTKLLNVEQITEAPDGHSVAVCEGEIFIPCRLATVASRAASWKLLEYERLYEADSASLDTEYPKFLYVMPMSPSGVFFKKTCLASRDAMPFDLLKKKLMSRLETMGIRVIKVYKEEMSYIPIVGSLPNTEQKNLAFGATASMVHPAIGYSVVRSLTEAPKYASAIVKILEQDNYSKRVGTHERIAENILMQAGSTLWPQERERQRTFFLFGLELILLLDIEGIRTFFNTFFRLPTWMWWGFLGSSLSSTDFILFSFYMFVLAPNNMQMSLVRYVMSDPLGAFMIVVKDIITKNPQSMYLDVDHDPLA